MIFGSDKKTLQNSTIRRKNAMSEYNSLAIYFLKVKKWRLGRAEFVCSNFKLHIYSLLSQSLPVKTF